MKYVFVSFSIFLFTLSVSIKAQIAFDYPPLNYSTAPLNNDIEKLRLKLEKGESSLEFDDKFGYLPALLKALNISEESQVLVFSKTSFQKELISAKTPRAIYFNDENYVGMVNGSDTLELSAVDSQVGAVFYTLNQSKEEMPKIIRNNDDCLDCHSSVRTQSVPGIVIRSIFLDKTDSLKTSVVNHRTPLNERWGSWYVTGSSGNMSHLGNIINAKGQPQKSSNINSLKEYFNTENYLRDSSDIAALMVFEHQAHMTNLITRANFRTRVTLHRQKGINERNKTSENHISEFAMDEIRRNCESLVKYLFFSEEAKLTDQISFNAEFTKAFYQNSPKDSNGRFLKKIKGKDRLFEYPVSFMIYSNTFSALPAKAREIIFGRMKEILTGKDKSADFKHLSSDMKKDLLKILLETHSEFKLYFNK